MDSKPIVTLFVVLVLVLLLSLMIGVSLSQDDKIILQSRADEKMKVHPIEQVHLRLETDKALYNPEEDVIATVIVDAGNNEVNGIQTCINMRGLDYEGLAVNETIFPNLLESGYDNGTLCVTVGVSVDGETKGRFEVFSIQLTTKKPGMMSNLGFNSDKTYITTSNGRAEDDATGQLIEKTIGTIYGGDCNSDGVVDLIDFNKVVSDFGNNIPTNSTCNPNHNTVRDLPDFSIVIVDYGKRLEMVGHDDGFPVRPPAEVSPVVEPEVSTAPSEGAPSHRGGKPWPEEDNITQAPVEIAPSQETKRPYISPTMIPDDNVTQGPTEPEHSWTME